jgi:hypothetical protein
MIANFATQGNNIAATSSGWTSITSAALGGSATKYGTLLYKIAGSAEASSYSFSLGSGTTGGAGAIIAFSGVDNTTPFDVATGTISSSASTSVTAGSITTVTQNTVVIMFGQAVGVTGGSSTSWSGLSWRTATSPGSLSEKYDAQQSTRRVSVGAAWALKSTAGSTGAGSATIASSVGNGGILIALRRRATDITPPTVASTTPANNVTGVATNTNITAVFSESLTVSTVNGTNVFLHAGTTSIPATVSYTAGSQNVVLDPTSSLTAGTVYTATLKGSTGGIQDAAGNNLAADYTWSFTTANAADVTAPVSSISSPSDGASFTVNQAITISGTASDAGGVNRVEVSVNGGSTWQAASGTNNWSYSWTPSSAGSYIIKSRGIDNTGNTEVAGTAPAANAINVMITAVVSDGCPCTIFTSSQSVQPSGSVFYNDGSALSLGTKFSTDTNGFITALRFYKASGNTGTHTGQLYTASGTLLSQAVFTNETASGWQQVNLTTPVQVTSGTVYVVSYHSSNGTYNSTNNYFTTAVVNGPLRGLANGENGGNGLYLYGGSPALPNASYQASNYWVDVVFSSSVGPDLTPPSVSSVSPSPNETGVSTTTSITAVFSEPLAAAFVTSSNALIRAGSTSIPALVSYTAGSNSILLTPTSALSNETQYTVTLKGGTDGIRDVAGNVMTADYTWNFTTAAPVSTTRATVFTSQQTVQPTSSQSSNDGSAIALGMKFRANTNGSVTALRFYKSSTNTGTHIGQLWSSAGTLLGQATFINETGSGWQEVSLPDTVAINAGTTYMVSYHSSAGNYSFTSNYFANAIVNGPLTGLANGTDGSNGLYSYTTTPAFPTGSYNASNYWVDVVFSSGNSGPDLTPPSVSSVSPSPNATGVSTTVSITAVFSEPLSASSVTASSVYLQSGATSVPATLSYTAGSTNIILTPSSPLSANTVYTVTLKGGTGANRILDAAGNALAADFVWNFTTGEIVNTGDPNQGPGGPILVISSSVNPFSRYYAEILRAEGLNSFYVMDISSVNSTVLNSYDVVLLGEMSVDASQVTMLTDWVTAGGTLVTFKPHSSLLPLLGLTSAGGSTLADRYLLVNTATGPGVGIVNQTIQYHGTADLYNLNGATSAATIYSGSSTSTTYPAVSINTVGSNGGKAVSFSYDLAKSVVYTRQGNPAWAGQKRDGQGGPIRSDDLFFPDYVDLNKVAIPQADEQQRLLTNIIIQNNLSKKPLPRFWFLPRKLKAAVVMTGDDHANGGTISRFNQYLGFGNNTAQDVQDWRAIRGTSYIYSSFSTSILSDAQASSFNAQGFEISLHLNTGCVNYSQSSLQSDFNAQFPEFTGKYPSLPQPTTHRTHCLAWSDWASKPKVENQFGIRLNTDYYYWPGSWIQNRPGMFTGSGMPMRFADLDGTLLDNYQVTTQMTDESDVTYPAFINTLLDNATGSAGYYGVFCANMHTDFNSVGNPGRDGSDAIIASAMARQIPVISAKQMLTWLDGRNTSSFGSMSWSSNNLNFTIAVGSGAYNLQSMLPVDGPGGLILNGIMYNGSAISYTTEVIKGMNYAFFDAQAGNYVATYGSGGQANSNGVNTNRDVTSPVTEPVSYFLGQNYPNPVNGSSTIMYRVPVSGKVEIALYDMQGRQVMMLVNEVKGAGIHKYELDAKLLSNGVYYYKMMSGNFVQVKRLIVE